MWANQSVEQMAAGGLRWQYHVPVTAAIAHFFRSPFQNYGPNCLERETFPVVRF
jgi:hypothetical protein